MCVLCVLLFLKSINKRTPQNPTNIKHSGMVQVPREETIVWEGCMWFFGHCQKISSISHKPVKTGQNLLFCDYLILPKHLHILCNRLNQLSDILSRPA